MVVITPLSSGNNNNNVNSANTLMFLPMVGKRSTLGSHHWDSIAEICSRHSSGQLTAALQQNGALTVNKKLFCNNNQLLLGSIPAMV